jgi:PAS domain S-box-containing protein
VAVTNFQALDRICTTAGSDLYRARRLDDGMPVLMKRLRSEHPDAAQSTRLEREYRLLQSLHVAGIAKPLALIDERASLAVLLEDFPGESLETVLGRDARMDLPVCLEIARHLADVLAGIDTAQVIHHDIRPANILIVPQTGQVLLVDVSIATAQERPTDAPEDVATSASVLASAPAGDWAYVSPEQTGRMNRPVDYRTDFYSLGVLLYRMATGQLPFQANDPLEWTHCHIARMPPPACDIAPAVPQAASDIVMKLLAKLPEDRYQSAHGLRADLDRCLAQWQAAGRIEPFSLGMEDISERFQVPHKLYGRDPEIERLLDAFERMAATGQAALATVCGYSGIGKSSLVHELQSPIVRERGYFIFGKFDQYQRDIPYATVTQAFRELVQQLLSESEARIAGWRQQIQAAVGVNGQLIVAVLPQVELIIGPQAPVPALPPTEAKNRFRMAFQQFIAVFTSKEHPLVLFLDDLQWIDAASLTLIEHLLTDSDTRYLLLIGAYRDNEVSAAHPLLASLDAIRQGGAVVIDLPLAPLSLVHLNQLVADTLHALPASCELLTHLICERTEGNPFFFIQFLDALHKEGLLWLDAQHRAWQWDLDQIKAQDFADNVVDLMVGKLRQLPLPAQEALQLAACLGNTFELRHLALISGQAEVEQHLAPAVRESLIVRTRGSGKFLHDRIQQAAYSLIPEERRAEVHLHIGRVLLASMTSDELAEHVFDVANQFNRGAALLIERDEKARVAALDLRAGRKAKASAAYASACVYLAAGMALIGSDGLDNPSQYELAFALYLERAECEYLSGNFDEAEGLIAELLARGGSKIDKAAAYRLKIDLHLMKSENPKGVECALECLRLFGIEMPAHPTREQVDAEYEKVWSNLGERPIESLIDLPLMTDPEMQAAMRVLSVLFAPAYVTDINLVRMHLCHMVNVSMKYGTTDASAQGYSWFGTTLGSTYGRYIDGYRFGKLACELVEKYKFLACRAKTYVPMEIVVLWTHPIETALDYIRAAFRAGVEAGDLAIACFSCNHVITDLLTRGDPLDEVWRESERCLDFVRKARFRDVVDIIVSQQRFIENMRGRSAHFSTFSDAHFDETAFEAQLTEDRMATMVCWYLILKVQARFMSSDYEAAIAAALKAKALLWSSDAHIQLLDYHYYSALAIAAAYETTPLDRQREWRALLTAHREQLREWAENYPPTFADKHALVSAEIARIEGRDADAMRLYEEAIQAAGVNSFVQNKGVAYECASTFYRTRGFEAFADTYIREARDCFARWGADGKVRQLDARYPQLQAQQPVRALTAPLDEVAKLDLLSVAKASQAISGQIVLDELVDMLMRIVLENAGAQTGHILLVRNDELVLAAEASVDQQTVRVGLRLVQGRAGVVESPPLGSPESPLPASILNYVRRSRERVLLADVAQPNPFSGDPYFAHHQPKSVLCLPILRQTALIGVLYLENSLITHAFTPERVTVLQLLASQAAISLENALLYADLLEREARIRRLVDSNIIGIFFWDFDGNVTDANDALLQIVGYSRQDLLAGNVAWSSMTPPEYRAADAQAIEELRRSGTCQPYEKEFIRKDGRRIPVLVGGALLEGSQEHGVAFVLDLTERKAAEVERAARRVAEAANQAKSGFLANMSHELRTPLNGILGYAQILRRDKTLDERQMEGLNVIQQSGEQLLTLINDILDFAKIEAGKLELTPNDIALARFLRIIAEIINVRAGQKDLIFICDMAPDLPGGIRVDERRLRQVLLNLLANAVKFTDRGHVSLRVRFVPPTRLRFEVQDTGIGVSADQLETIFQPFEQVSDPQRRLGGAGLGLAISRQFVRLMGGDIHVKSQVGVGSTFWFELKVPLVETEIVAPAERSVTGYAGPRKKVLVVDDVAANRAMAVDMLGQLGFDVIEAVNGREALEKAQSARPDWILTDIVMPEMDGLEATRRLRQLPGLQNVPIIAMSASASGSDELKSMAAGVNAFVAKPIDLDKLLAQVASVLKLNWTYEPNAAPAAEGEASGPLVAPPAQDLERLHQLARWGNMRDIVQWAERVAALDERYRPFADRLRLLARGYESKAILALVERYLESRPDA